MLSNDYLCIDDVPMHEYGKTEVLRGMLPYGNGSLCTSHTKRNAAPLPNKKAAVGYCGGNGEIVF